MKGGVLLLLFLQLCNGLNILVWNPAFGHSHSKFMGRVADSLVEAGHNVTEIVALVKPEDYKKVSHLTTIHTIPQDPRLVELNKRAHQEGGMMISLWTSDPSPSGLKKLANEMHLMFEYSCERTIEETQLWEKLKKQKFDVGISEALDMTGHGMMKMLGVETTISTSSSFMMDHMAQLLGVPIVPSYVPGGVRTPPEEWSMMDRGMNGLASLIGASIFLDLADKQTAIFRRKVRPDFPDLKSLIPESSLVFTNSLPHLDLPHPTIHKVVDIGGIGITKHKPLSEEWSNILNQKAQNVLISFGTVVKTKEMPQELKEGIIATIRRLPDVRFIWKYEGDDLTNIPDNLILSKWTPQSDLLADKRLSLFVTHGGLGSATEIAYGGTPAIVIPLFADQPRNAMMLKREGVAESISKFEIVHPDKLYEVIKKVLDDPSYAENSKRLSELVNNVPFSPKDLLVKNVEFVGRFGKLPQLDPYGRQLSFVQYFLLDVVAVIVAVVFVVLLVLYYGIKKVISYCCVHHNKTKRE